MRLCHYICRRTTISTRNFRMNAPAVLDLKVVQLRSPSPKDRIFSREVKSRLPNLSDEFCLGLWASLLAGTFLLGVTNSMGMERFWDAVYKHDAEAESLAGNEPWLVTGQEVAALLRRMIDGSARFSCDSNSIFYSDVVHGYVADDEGLICEIGFFIDAGFLDYCVGVILNGRTGSFNVWDSLNQEPVEMLTEAEQNLLAFITELAAKESSLD